MKSACNHGGCGRKVMHQPRRQISQAKDAPAAAAAATVPGGWLVLLQTTQWQQMTELTEAHMGHFEPVTHSSCLFFCKTSGDENQCIAFDTLIGFTLFPDTSRTGL